jgi:hypothetical protein
MCAGPLLCGCHQLKAYEKDADGFYPQVDLQDFFDIFPDGTRTLPPPALLMRSECGVCVKKLSPALTRALMTGGVTLYITNGEDFNGR